MARYPSLYQINTRVWLRELSDRLARPATLADIPDGFLDQVAALGFDYLWFLGLWQTGVAGRQVSLSHPEWLLEFPAPLSRFPPGYALQRNFCQEADLLANRFLAFFLTLNQRALAYEKNKLTLSLKHLLLLN